MNTVELLIRTDSGRVTIWRRCDRFRKLEQLISYKDVLLELVGTDNLGNLGNEEVDR